MHSLETIKLINTKAAIQGVSRRAKNARRVFSARATGLADLALEETADRALAGDITAWDAMVAELARREAE